MKAFLGWRKEFGFCCALFLILNDFFNIYGKAKNDMECQCSRYVDMSSGMRVGWVGRVGIMSESVRDISPATYMICGVNIKSVKESSCLALERRPICFSSL